MRRVLAISLMFFVATPFASALITMGMSNVIVPFCCRRHGKHHCMTMRMNAQSSQDTFQVSAQSCPYAPEFFSLTHHSTFALDVQRAIFADVVSHPSAAPQVQAKRRISETRARLKRGPPAFFLS
jgi:hypothetical protein